MSSEIPSKIPNEQPPAMGFDDEETQRVNLDFPKSFLQDIDREARFAGVPRQAFLKVIIYQEVKRLRSMR